MPVTKPKRPTRYRRHDGLTPQQAATRYAVMKAKPPKRDETAAIELAQQFGADVADVLELWHERAAVRTYDAGDDIGSAEMGALSDVREILTARAERFAKP